MSDASTATSRLIGDIFVERGLVTAEQLEKALELQLSTGDRLGEILVAHFGVPRLELASVLAEQWSEADRAQPPAAPPQATPAAPSLEAVEREVEELGRRPIGEIFVQGGFVTEDELERALVVQRETGQRLGEVLVAQGSITRLELASALAEQWAGVPKLRPPASAPPAGENGGHIEARGSVAPATPVTESVSAVAGERLDEVTSRLDELAARAASAAELAALRAELDELAARPAADPALAARVEGLDHRLQSLADMESLRSGLAERVEELELRIHAVGGLDGDLQALRVGIDELRSRPGVDSEARARLDALAAQVQERPSPSAGGAVADEGLAERLDAIERRLAQTAGADDVREAFAAVREEMGEVAAALEEAPDLDAVTRRLQNLEARLSDSSEQHKIRTAIADLQAEVGALGGHQERGRLDSVVERLDTLEGSLPAPTVLDTLRDDVARLLARPEVDTTLVARLEQLASRVDEHESLGRQLEQLGADIEAVRARPAVDTAVREQLESLASRVDDLARRPEPAADETLAPRLDEIERRLTLVPADADVREGFAAVRDEMSEVAARLEGLAVPPDLTAEVERLARSVAELAESPRAVIDDTMASRLAALEQRLAEAVGEAGVREAFAAVREEMRDVAARLDELDVPPDLSGDVEALRGRVNELAAASRPETDDTLAPRLGEVERRLSLVPAETEVRESFSAMREELGEVSARLERLAVPPDLSAEVEALRRSLAELAEAPRVEMDETLAPRLAALEQRLAESGADDDVRHELASLQSLMSSLRDELAALENRAENDGRFDAVHARIDDLAARLGQPADLDPIRVAVESLRTKAEAREHADAQRRSDTQALRGRLDAVEERAEALAARLDEATALDGQLAELRAELETIQAHPAGDPRLDARVAELAEQMARLAGDAARNDDVVALRDTVAELELRPAADPTLPDRLGELARRAEAWQAAAEGVEELRAQLEKLAARPLADPSLGSRVGDLQQRVHELDGRIGELAADDALHEELDALRQSVRMLEQATDPYRDLPARLGALSGRVDLLEPASARLDELAARVEELSARPPGDPALASRLDEVEQRLADAAGLGATLQRVEGELVELRRYTDESTASLAAGATALDAALRARLHEVAEESRAGTEASGRELGLRIDETAARLESLDVLAGRADALEAGGESLRQRVEELASTQEAGSAALAAAIERAAASARDGDERVRVELAELGATAERRAEELEALARELTGELGGRLTSELTSRLADLGQRIDALAGREPVDAEARAGVAGAQKKLGRLGDTLEELRQARAETTSLVETAVAELGARLDELAVDTAEERIAAEASIRADVDAVAARLEERDAAGIVARDEARAEVERVASSLGWRLERVEEALAADDGDVLRQAISHVQERLDRQDARQEEQARVTERALRKGLASLGDRLAENEAEYVKAGDALRRSIERLGSVIVDADVAAVERADEESLALHHANATSYVAFAPTTDGYRMVAVDGRAPAVGERVELPQCEGELVVTRLGASPIPLDTRPCAYLERA